MVMFNSKLLVYQRVAKSLPISLHSTPNLTGAAHIFNSMGRGLNLKPHPAVPFSQPDEPRKCQETTRISNFWNGYPLVMSNIAIEMAHLKFIFLY